MNNIIFEERVKNRVYYMDKSGVKFRLYEFLNCIEKLVFYQLINQNAYCYDKFLTDINICIKSEKLQHYLKPYAKASLEDFVHIEKETPNMELKEYVENALDNDILGFNTYFDLLPEYFVYNPKSQGTEKGHVSALVAYDSKYYYIVDDPAVLKMKIIKSSPLNAQVHMIEKNKLLRILEKRGIFYKIDIKKITYRVPLIEVLSKSLSNYWETEFPDNMIWGVKAYEEFSKELGSTKFKYYEEFFKTWWELQVIMAQREVLKLYLERSEYVFESEKLLKLLNDSVKRWGIFRNIVMRNSIAPHNRFQQMVKDNFLQISDIEEQIMKEIEYLLSKKSFIEDRIVFITG